MRHNLLSHRAESPLTIRAARTARLVPPLPLKFRTRLHLSPASPPLAHAATLPAPTRAANRSYQVGQSTPPGFPSKRLPIRPSPIPDFPSCLQKSARLAPPEWCEIPSATQTHSIWPPLRLRSSRDLAAHRYFSIPRAAPSLPDAA